MNNKCVQSGQRYEVTDDDIKFYERVAPQINGKSYSFPAPTLSPLMRMKRRLSFRNERNFYHRKCDFSGKQIVSMYSTDKPFKVYDQEVWWSDKWDGLEYGRDFDFSRTFFEQFAELMLEVPRLNLNNLEHENSEYCNFVVRNKDCYLIFTSAFNEACSYSNRIMSCTDVLDCSGLEKCELCYEVVDSDDCYSCAYLENCSNCSDCWLGYDLRGCSDCFACFSLVNKQYCIGNKQYSKEDYEKKVAEMKAQLPQVMAGYRGHLKEAVRKYFSGMNIENCTGDNILNCKDCVECFEVQDLQDCKYCCNTTKLKDCYDCDNNDNSELCLECIGAEGDYGKAFCDISWYDKFIYYCSLCFHSENLFGCIGLRKKKYCILNKQYTKEEYEELLPRIIEHMKGTGEWGEFFPSKISPFAYNETMAQVFFPMTKEEVLVAGLKWKDDDSEKNYKGPDYEVPERIEDVDDDICKAILRCEVTGKLYKITPQELRFYRRLGLRVPRKCPDQRYKERVEHRNGRVLNDRKCDKCGIDIKSTYNPERVEPVYCEKCYLEMVS